MMAGDSDNLWLMMLARAVTLLSEAAGIRWTWCITSEYESMDSLQAECGEAN
jgi:hypothetical protein